MKILIECDTCGYSLLPEEREGLVEIDGKMCKPRKPLTDDELTKLITDTWGSAGIAPISASAFARAIEQAHGIGEEV
jgi:hypothetical protein